jgi:membrane protease YdiL (CAAX protease family)
MENDLNNIMSSKTTEELIKITQISRNDYQEKALEAANKELEYRNISKEEIESVAQSIIKNETKNTERKDNTVHSRTSMTNIKNKNYPNIGQSIRIVGIMILVAILMSPVLYLNKFISVDKEATMLIYYVLSVGIPFGIVYVIRKRKTGIRTFNLEIRNKRIIPFIIITTIALLLGVVMPIINLIPMPEFFQQAFFEMANQKGFFSFLLMVIAAPIFEELIFRGIILDGLLKKYSSVKSILISSTLFGLIHLNPWQFVTAFTIGIFSGWIYYKTKSLSLAVLIHFTSNLIGYINIFLNNNYPMEQSLMEYYGGTLNLVFIIIGCLFVITLSVFYLRREFKKNSVNACY